ncbi:MAG: T9SS type A sorting domain-containing protein [Ignavibacteria bacterium]
MYRIILLFFFSFLSISFSSKLYPQSNNIIDSFGDYKLTGWYWGGNLTMKYSHQTDNLENGYAEIFSNDSKVSPNSYVGLIRKDQKVQIVEENIFSVMLQGTGTDVFATLQLLYDKNNDGKYDENADARLESKPIPLDFSGWKEIHLNINDKEFKVLSKLMNEDFSLLESEAIGIQISYQTGKSFNTSKLETGIAMLAERPNKELKQENAAYQDFSGESYFNLKNYPNPFNPETNITYSLKNSTYVKITVYDRLGREVVVLVDEQQSEGDHSAVFNGSSFPSGIYFYRLKTSEGTEVKKMVLAK